MNTQRILIIAAWLASLAAAYFIGGSGEPARSPASVVVPANATPAGPVGIASVASPRAGDAADDAKETKRNIPSIIAQARLQMGGGMGGMMNIRSMLRAIAPIAELDDSQLQEALAEVEKTVREPQQKMMFYSLLLGQWAETDGRAAMAYAEGKLEKGSMFNMGITSSVLSTWAHRDPDAVWKWLETEHKDDGSDRSRMMALSAVFAGFASSNLESALSRLGSLDDPSRAMALGGIAMSAQDDTSRRRLLDRTASLPPEQRNQLRQGAIGQWAMSNPEEAVAWVRSLPADEQKPVRESAGQMMLMMKPALAADFMLEGAEEKDKPQIYDRVVMQWAGQDARAAGEWLTKQPQGPELDGARRTFATVVAQRDPSAAMDWARSVQDQDQRTQSVGQVYQMWRGKDPKAADAALGAAGLPPDKLKELREAQPAASTIVPGSVQIRSY